MKACQEDLLKKQDQNCKSLFQDNILLYKIRKNNTNQIRKTQKSSTLSE
jgi:hypothetical protein